MEIALYEPSKSTHIPRRACQYPQARARPPRHPCCVPVRMTASERAAVGQKAYALNVSVSRFLVERGIGNQAQASDTSRLRYLHTLFDDAASRAKALLASPLFAVKNEHTADAKLRLEEVAYLLKALAGELARRLP